MRRWAVLLALAGIFALQPALTQPGANAADRPSWCQDGWICLPTPDAAALYDELERLEGEVSRLQRLSRRFGGTWGGQGGISPWDGQPYAGVGYCWGWRTQR